MSEYKDLNLDHQLCFGLYAALHSVTKAYRVPLEKCGLTYSQYLVMLVLWESNNINVNTIAQRLELNSATLTPMLKRLGAAGFITRLRSNRDERLIEVKLTEIGSNLRHEIAKVQQSVERQTRLSQEEFIQLRDSLHSLVETMNESTKDHN